MDERSVSDAKEFQSQLIQNVPRLRRVAFRLTRSRADADDLVQDTLCKALRNRELFAMGTSMSAWLQTILRNTFVDGARMRGRQEPLPDDLTAEPAAESPPWWLDLEPDVLRGAVSRLDQRLRRTFELHAGGMSYRQIAKVHRVPLATVGTRLMRARRRLRRMLQDGRPRCGRPRASGSTAPA
jgi:RNA polymerase sigma-70 factor, ECF subfamily